MIPKDVREVIDDCDVLIEVVDARDIPGTRSQQLEQLIRKKKKKLIIVVNKIDLARPKRLPQGNVVLMSATKRKGTKMLRSAIHASYPKMIKIKAGLVGYANTGKSSIINALGGGARTSSRPGFTRGTQWLKVTNRIMLFDSPGIIPRGEGEMKLAIKGAYDTTKLKDAVGTALRLIDKIGSKKLVKVYKVEPFEDTYEQLEELAGKWMMLKKGAELDLDRASKKLIKDWQVGKLK